MKHIIFVRHGQCQANVDRIVAGSKLDSPLTPLGIEQATEVAGQLKDKGIELIVSSPLSRTKDSAKIIAEAIGIDPAKIVIMPEFNERDVGVMTLETLDEYYRYESKKVIPEAETEAEMFARVKAGLEKLKQLKAQTILVVSHNGTYRMMRCVLENKKPNDFSDVPTLHNSKIFEFNLRGE